jgi:type I restriction enzyme S subunit
MSELRAIGSFAKQLKRVNDGSSSTADVYSVTKYDGFIRSLDYFKKQVFSRDLSSYKIVRKGEFAYSTIHLDEGALGLLEDKEALISPMYTTFQVDESVDRQYIAYLLKSPDLVAQYSLIGQGSINRRKSVAFSSLAELEAFIPPLPEQKKIAEILSGIDRVIFSNKHKIQCLQLLKKALVCRHVENTGNAIEEAKLYEVLVSMDSGWSPDCLKRPPLSANEWSVLKTTSVTWKGFNQEERKALPNNLVPRQDLVVEEGDILITRAGPADRTGVIAYADKNADKVMISDKIIRLRCDKSRVNPRFLSIFLSTDYAQRQILKGKAGMASSQTNISQQLLRDMTVRFPPQPEQRHISEIVAELQKLINQVEECMEHTEKLKTSLSADLLSGRKRVTL